MTLRQVRGLRRPVVHLCIDIDGVLALARRRHEVAPQSLQVSWLAARPRTRDQEIPAILKVQLRQLWVVALKKLHWPLVRRQTRRFACAEIELHATKQALMFSHMGFAQLLKS